jgi:predicted nucleotidyltransferase
LQAGQRFRLGDFIEILNEIIRAFSLAGKWNFTSLRLLGEVQQRINSNKLGYEDGCPQRMSSAFWSVDAISPIEGVLAIILFGSRAKGKADEYSDYDLMVIFRDKSSMWAAWKELFKRVGRLRILAHVIPKSLDEFFKMEPTLFEEIRSHGKVLFLRYPLSMPMLLGTQTSGSLNV